MIRSVPGPDMKEYTVSPVIGMMLMLSITFIIAALVSLFAGGSISMPSKTPQATIRANCSRSGGMKIMHTGGDPTPVGSATVWVCPTNSFGDKATKFSWHIDKDHIYGDMTESWNSSPSFIAGNMVMIYPSKLKCVQTRPDGITTENDSGSDLDFYDR